MRPARLILLLIFAAFLAAEPVVHTHPLLPQAWGGDANGITTPNVCAICGVTNVQIPVGAPALAPPDLTVERTWPVCVVVESAGAILPSSSRAPPAA